MESATKGSSDDGAVWSKHHALKFPWDKGNRKAGKLQVSINHLPDSTHDSSLYPVRHVGREQVGKAWQSVKLPPVCWKDELIAEPSCRPAPLKLRCLSLLRALLLLQVLVGEESRRTTD